MIDKLELADALADVLSGFRQWRDMKIRAATLDDQDEMFIRWIEAGPTGGGDFS